MTDSQIIKNMEGQISGLNKDVKDMEKLLIRAGKMDRFIKELLMAEEAWDEKIEEVAMVMGE